MTNAVQFKTDVQVDESALQALSRITALPEPVVQDAAEKGAVWVSLQRGRSSTRPRRLYTLDTQVVAGSTLMLNYDPQVLAQNAQSMYCVSDQVNYGIWFKPSGMLCQGSKWSDHTVATQVAQRLTGKHCYLVHRLDKATCGLLIVAYTKNALRKLAQMFEQREIHKHYQAHVKGKFTHPLPQRLDTPIDDRHALTTILSMRYDSADDRSALRLSIDTGRKHQIRKHISGLGYPVIGDRMYSKQNTATDAAMGTTVENLQLVAYSLRFVCPFSAKEIAVSIDADKALAGTLTEDISS